MDPSLSWSNKSLQIVCSTLIPSFDQLIGGGFAVSSLNVIDEDCDRIYSSMLTKAYISSAIIANQRVIIFSSSIKTKNARFLKELPVQSAVNDYEEKTPNTDDALKIAFRYSNLPSYPSGDVSATVRLDFGNNIDASVLENASVDFYEHSDIISILENLISSTNIKSNVCRILIDQIDSPLSTLSVSQLPKIFHRIKVLIRQLPNSVCLATLSSDRCNKTFNYGLLETISPSIRNRVHVLSDCVVRLIGIDEDENDNNPYSADYVGFLHLLRLPRLNSLAPYNPTLEATEFGIKLRNSKRYLTIEKLALPPDLGETVNRFTSSVQVTDNKSCSKTFVNF